MDRGAPKTLTQYKSPIIKQQITIVILREFKGCSAPRGNNDAASCLGADKSVKDVQREYVNEVNMYWKKDDNDNDVQNIGSKSSSSNLVNVALIQR